MPRQFASILKAAVAGAGLMAATGLSAAQAAPSKVGWLWANDSHNTVTYTPNTQYSFNSTGGAYTSTRLSMGVYRVVLGGMASAGPTNVMMTRYNGPGYCTVGSWSTQGADVLAYINCFSASGAPDDGNFTLLYQARNKRFGNAAKGIAYLWADQPSTPSYTPSTLFQFNSTGGTNTINRTGVGVYDVLLPGFDKLGGNVQVSAYGSSAARCKVVTWNQDTPGTTAEVACFDASGAPSDHQFTLTYSRSIPAGWVSDDQSRGVYAWSSTTKKATYKLDKSYAYNGFGTGKLAASRDSQGVYIVTIPGAHSYVSSNMLTTSYGDGNTYCDIVGWENLITECYNQAGTVADSRYSMDFNTVVSVP